MEMMRCLDATTTSGERTDATLATGTSDGATNTSGELKDRTDARMTTESSDGATTASDDLRGGDDATMTIEESDDDGSHRPAPRMIGNQSALDATHPTTATSVNKQRHHCTNKSSGASR